MPLACVQAPSLRAANAFYIVSDLFTFPQIGTGEVARLGSQVSGCGRPNLMIACWTSNTASLSLVPPYMSRVLSRMLCSFSQSSELGSALTRAEGDMRSVRVSTSLTQVSRVSECNPRVTERGEDVCDHECEIDFRNS